MSNSQKVNSPLKSFKNNQNSKKIDLIFNIPWYKFDKASYEKIITEISEWGVRKIVVPQYFYHKDDTDKGGFVGEINTLAKRHGIQIAAAHALLGIQFDLGLANRETLNEHQRFLFELAETDTITYTLHPGMHHFASNTLSEKFWSQLESSLNVLLPIAEKTGITLALENIYETFTSLKRMVKLVDSFKHPLLGLCLDTGHANISENGIDKVLTLMAPQTVTCHLHDNDGVKDEHKAPSSGTINWNSLSTKLAKLPRLLHAETETRAYSYEIWQEFNRLSDAFEF